MNFAQMSGYILLVLMILLVFETTKYVAGARYNGRGIYYLTVNAWFRCHRIYRKWLWDNFGYYLAMGVIVALIPTILMLVGPFSKGDMLVRPEWSPFINVVLWVFMFLLLRFFYNKQK